MPTSVFDNLPNEAKLILDMGLNVGAILRAPYFKDNIELLTGVESSEGLEAAWQTLLARDIIHPEEYYWVLSHVEETKRSVSDFLEDLGVNANKVTDVLEGKVKNRPDVLTLLMQISARIFTQQRNKSITFTDGEWNNQLGSLCDELTQDRMLFRHSSSSKKHSYRTYFVRRWPFECEEIINNTILKFLNVGGLGAQEWQVISLLLLAKTPELDWQSVRVNLDLSGVELQETMTSLRERGLIQQLSPSSVKLVEGLRSPLDQYFKLNFYPKWKSEIVSDIRQRASRNLSALWLVLTAKQIYDLPVGDFRSEPISNKSFDISQIGAFESNLPDLRDTHMAFQFGSTVVILGDVINELGDWIRGSLRESLVFIPARDYYLARSVFLNIFDKCEEYVKIEMPYIGAEDFDIVEYAPIELEIKNLDKRKTRHGRRTRPNL